MCPSLRAQQMDAQQAVSVQQMPIGPVTLSDADQVAKDFELFVKDAVARRGLAALPVQTRLEPAGSGLAWWAEDAAGATTGAAAGSQAFALADLVDKASVHSLQIGTFSTLPAIRDTAIAEAQGRFAPELFAEARHSNRNERTTALSQTAGDERLRETENVAEFGLRTRLRTGAEVTLSQRFSNLDSNIITYNPDKQSRARTTLGVVQPLLRGAGTAYGTAIERIAGNRSEERRVGKEC